MASITQRIKNNLQMPEISWARLVSDIISPPLVWAALAVPVGVRYSETTQRGLLWAGLFSLFICVIPLLYVMLMVWRGSIGDVHMKERSERIRPLLLTIACTTCVWWMLRSLEAPPVFSMLALLSLVQVTMLALITLAWQISMHMMTISGVVIATGVIFSMTTALLLVPVVMLVGAARLNLKRHTPAQVIAGTMLGAAVPALLLVVLPASLVGGF